MKLIYNDNQHIVLFIYLVTQEQQLKKIRLHYIGPGRQSLEDVPPEPMTRLHSPEGRGDTKPVLPLGSAGQAEGQGQLRAVTPQCHSHSEMPSLHKHTEKASTHGKVMRILLPY